MERMNPDKDALEYLQQIVTFIKWKATDDPFLAEAVKYLDTDLVDVDIEDYPRSVSLDEAPWFDCYFEDDWDDYWDSECWDCKFPCEENCGLNWSGCHWSLPPSNPNRTWRFRFDGVVYQLNTPSLTLYDTDTMQHTYLDALTAARLLEAIQLMIVREINEL